MTTTSLLVSHQGSIGVSAWNTLATEDTPFTAGVSISTKKRNGGNNLTTITFSGYVITVPTSVAYVGNKLFTFPLGELAITGSVGSLTFTTTSILANTLNLSSAGGWGFGTATASNVTLSTTMQNIVSVTTFTSSATISVANTATTGILATPANLNGTATANPCYFNVGITTANAVDADATVQVDGSVTFEWHIIGTI